MATSRRRRAPGPAGQRRPGHAGRGAAADVLREEHLPGAINIPHDQVDALAPALLPDVDAEIVVYCASGPCQNSGIASRRLASLGYSDVSDYQEGKAEWVAAELPVERGAPAAPVAQGAR